jgi:thiol-disulfide isomerase/thioredoxin
VAVLAALHAAASDSVVTVGPACPQWEMPAVPGLPMIAPTIVIRYNPAAPGARLKSPQALNVILANALNINRFESVTMPLLRSNDGTWEVTFTPKKNYLSGYSIFFFQNEKGQVDNNQTRYWEILQCVRGQVNPLAVEQQARTYEGTLLAPGIQRVPDLGQGIEILKADLQARPLESGHYFALWDMELREKGRIPAAFEQIGKELDAFLGTLGTSAYAMQQVSGFVSRYQKQLPPNVVARYRAALIALPETAEPFQINAATKEKVAISREKYANLAQQNVTRMLGDFDFQAIDREEPDPRKKAEAYLRFAADHPKSIYLSSAYYSAFQCQKELGDTAAIEATFEKWNAVAPPQVQPLLEMAEYYVDQKTKPARAIELLNAAEKIYIESEKPTSHNHFHRDPGKLESLRGQAHLLLADLPAARADFEAAWKAAPDKPEMALALGKLCEQTGDNTRALAVYLAGAAVPYQKDSQLYDAYSRLFTAQRQGSKQEAEERIAKQAEEGVRTAADEYTPLPLNRPAPEFAFTDLAGKRLDNQAAKGKPAVITFWGIWCPPCIAELPAMEEFQKHHPAANMLAVEIGDKPDKVKAFLAKRKLSALRVSAGAAWPEDFGAAAAPMTVVIDRFGQIQFVHSGLLANVEAILGKDLNALPELN